MVEDALSSSRRLQCIPEGGWADLKGGHRPQVLTLGFSSFRLHVSSWFLENIQGSNSTLSSGTCAFITGFGK
ncbi:MAG: hypothetical protein PWK00_10535, partial [Coxiella burnetii]|nr:hypothetical protein [Coxiella burnetii]